MLFRLLKRLREAYERVLFKEVSKGKLPEHIAIIMDGNRRYARLRGKPVYEGHKNGAKTTEMVLDTCSKLGIKTLTVYAFSTENFSRSYEERKYILGLIEEKLRELLRDKRTYERKVRVSVIGDFSLLPESLRKTAKEVEDATAENNRLLLNIAIGYGGRRDLVGVVKKLARKVETGELDVDDIDEEVVSNHLYAENGIVIPDVDLLIRTGGEQRLSNFLPWQTSGSESATYFCSPYWPEFRKIDLLRAIRTYQRREIEREEKLFMRVMSIAKEWGVMEIEEGLEIYHSILKKMRKKIISFSAPAVRPVSHSLVSRQPSPVAQSSCSGQEDQQEKRH
ncbi:di-trans,poly-cis-decaprenylcistransferase [Methanosarcinales archaeon]|nr:MAG: di-trans,poly-cis-decaprenylcistransferase [Methanosarcinales archaeon]